MKKKSNINRFLLIAASIVIIVLAYIWIGAMTRLGEFSSLKPRFDGNCKMQYVEHAGIEDFQIIKSEGNEKLILSSFDRISAKNDTSLEGALYIYDLKSASLIETLKAPNGFSPLGIDFLGDDARIIGAINNKGQARIELFSKNVQNYSHTKTVQIPNANRLNDIALIDENRFFVTNEGEYHRDSFKNFVLNLLDRDKSGSIYFYDGQKAKKVADGLTYANSVLITKDKKYLIASATLGREIRFYEIQPNFDLKLLKNVFLGTGIDNLSFDEEGRIFAGSHPKLFTLTRKMWSQNVVAPAQAIVIEPNQDFSGGNIDQVYLSDGKSGIGSVATAIKYKNQLFMGSIFDKGLMICELPKEWHHSKSHPANRLIDTARDYQIKKAKKDLEKGH